MRTLDGGLGSSDSDSARTEAHNQFIMFIFKEVENRPIFCLPLHCVLVSFDGSGFN